VLILKDVMKMGWYQKCWYKKVVISLWYICNINLHNRQSLSPISDLKSLSLVPHPYPQSTNHIPNPNAQSKCSIPVTISIPNHNPQSQTKVEHLNLQMPIPTAKPYFQFLIPISIPNLRSSITIQNPYSQSHPIPESNP